MVSPHLPCVMSHYFEIPAAHRLADQRGSLKNLGDSASLAGLLWSRHVRRGLSGRVTRQPMVIPRQRLSKHLLPPTRVTLESGMGRGHSQAPSMDLVIHVGPLFDKRHASPLSD